MMPARSVNATNNGDDGARNVSRTVSALTVLLTLRAPSSPLLVALTDRAGIMISPKAAAAAGDKFGLHPVCAGPFAFESRVAQDKIVLKRFPGYWDAANIHFDEV